MADAPAGDEPPNRGSYQLTEDQRIDILVAIALEAKDGEVPRGVKPKIAKAFSILHTAVSYFANRLLAGDKPASQIVRSKK